MGLSPLQENQRRSFLGASDIPAILGFNEWKTPWHVYWSKFPLEDQPQELQEKEAKRKSKALRSGDILEEAIMKWMIEYLDPCGVIEFDVQVIHPEIPYLGANLDGTVTRWTTKGKTRESPALLEGKTTGFSGTPLEKFGRALSKNIPPRVMLQMQAQLLVTGWDTGWLCVLSGHDGSGFKMYRVSPDKNIHAKIIKAAKTFWEKYMIPNNEPPKGLKYVK